MGDGGGKPWSVLIMHGSEVGEQGLSKSCNYFNHVLPPHKACHFALFPCPLPHYCSLLVVAL